MTGTTKKKILITGATDGIGLATAKKLVEQGHYLLLHGRNEQKIQGVVTELLSISADAEIETYVADMSRLAQVKQFAKAVSTKHEQLDVLINNAGVFKTPQPITEEGLDVRFVVNTIAPYQLTQDLMPLLGASSRVANLSSAAQAPVDFDALKGDKRLSDMEAYSQSKLAITMWSRTMAQRLQASGPIIIAVNPGSLLASKMVKEGFGVPGSDINIGANILIRASLSEEFATATGAYFDNDSGNFASPHPDGLDDDKAQRLENEIQSFLVE